MMSVNGSGIMLLDLPGGITLQCHVTRQNHTAITPHICITFVTNVCIKTAKY